MFKPISTLLCDCYKIAHKNQYPEGTTRIYSNFTPRNTKYFAGRSEFYDDKIVVFGIQYFVKNILVDLFNEEFFSRRVKDVCSEYEEVVREVFMIPKGVKVETSHIARLHALQKLPLIVKALPEGSIVPAQTPILTVENTIDEFFWLTNYIETALSASLWVMCTNATMAREYRKICDSFASYTCADNSHVDFQCHDFSMRGMSSIESAIMSGMAHLTSFKGTDTLPAISAMKYFYKGDSDVGYSVPASEHSVMTCGGRDGELETIERIMSLYPTGIFSLVLDGYDYWNALTVHLPKLKDNIMARSGKFVVRPDSGDPVKIICGDPDAPEGSPEHKGSIEVLWKIFGGTFNNKGYKVLDSHIGLIYGDSITIPRAIEILTLLRDKGFASSNVVFGVGSFSYQYNTRDSLGFAVKATYAKVNGEDRMIFKAPKTDLTKKSKTGKMLVLPDYSVIDGLVSDDDHRSILKTVFNEGGYKTVSLYDIRTRIKGM